MDPDDALAGSLSPSSAELGEVRVSPVARARQSQGDKSTPSALQAPRDRLPPAQRESAAPPGGRSGAATLVPAAADKPSSRPLPTGGVPGQLRSPGGSHGLANGTGAAHADLRSR